LRYLLSNPWWKNTTDDANSRKKIGRRKLRLRKK
jgi:hypothetical protein